MFRDEFHMPKTRNGSKESIYLAGHSLGPQPKTVEGDLKKELAKWSKSGVRGHFEEPEPWVKKGDGEACELMSRLVGADKDEVALCLTLTANLHLLLATFYKPTKQRYKILIEDGAFPSDTYAVHSQTIWHGFAQPDAIIKADIMDADGSAILSESMQRIIQEEGDSIALVLIPGIQYLTGELVDLQRLTALAHAKGCVVGADLAHAFANVPLLLHDWNVDWAVWCTYKYGCGGPGALGGLFVHARHDSVPPALAGWWGNDLATRFTHMRDDHFEPAKGARRFALSTLDILSCTAVVSALRILTKVPLEEIYKESARLVHYFVASRPSSLSIVTPMDRHGAQVSIRLSSKFDVHEIVKQLDTRFGIVADARPPDIIRFGFSGAFVGTSDVDALCAALSKLFPQ